MELIMMMFLNWLNQKSETLALPTGSSELAGWFLLGVFGLFLVQTLITQSIVDLWHHFLRFAFKRDGRTAPKSVDAVEVLVRLEKLLQKDRSNERLIRRLIAERDKYQQLWQFAVHEKSKVRDKRGSNHACGSSSH